MCDAGFSLTFLSVWFLAVLYNIRNVSLVLPCVYIAQCSMSARGYVYLHIHPRIYVRNMCVTVLTHSGGDSIKSSEIPHLNFQGKRFLIKLCYVLRWSFPSNYSAKGAPLCQDSTETMRSEVPYRMQIKEIVKHAPGASALHSFLGSFPTTLRVVKPT